jgi:hypothetical protein
MNKVVFIPDVSEEIRGRIASHGSVFASRANDSIRQFNLFAERIPKEYQWTRISDVAFESWVKNIASDDTSNKAARINEAYWNDLLRQLEAMVVMSTWRAADLGRTAVSQINRGDLGSGAIIARSSLENSAFLLHVARKFFGIVDDLRNQDFRTDIIAGDEIERFVVRAVFGSGKESSETEHEVAFNVLSAIKSVDKVYARKGSEEIFQHYANFTGKALYIQSDERLAEPGHYRTTISRSPGQLNEHVLTASVAALSWAMMSQVSASNLMSVCIKKMNILVNDAAS